jgi:hypothetical protein
VGRPNPCHDTGAERQKHKIGPSSFRAKPGHDSGAARQEANDHAHLTCQQVNGREDNPWQAGANNTRLP